MKSSSLPLCLGAIIWRPDYLVVRYAEQLLARTRRRYHRCCYLFRRLHGSERLRYFKTFSYPSFFHQSSLLFVGWITLHVIFAICHSFKPATGYDNCNRLQVVSAALMALLMALMMRKNPWVSSLLPF